MPNILLVGRSGEDVLFANAESVSFPTETEGEEATFSYGEVVDGVEVDLDFSDGDVVVSANEGELLKEVTILKPENLQPQNIAKDVEIGGVVGLLEGGTGALDSLIDGTATEITSNVEAVNIRFQYAAKNIVSADFPLAKTVGEYAFYYCSKLKNINIPLIESIGNYGFCSTNIEIANFPLLKSAGNYSFSQSTVKEVSFPILEDIPYCMFYQCYSLKNMNLPKIKTIGSLAFNSVWNDNFMEANFPLVTTLGSYAFRECNKLITANFPLLTTLGSDAFYNCSRLKNVNIPLVTTIPSAVFYGNSVLEKIDLPSVTGFSGSSAFSSCSKLETVILKSEIVATLANANNFNGTKIASGTGYIYVPQTLIEDYKVATNWSTYATQFRAIEDYPDICNPTT